MSLLDPHFQYTPSVATDVSATWRRFGFRPSDNDARRDKWRVLFQPGISPRARPARETVAQDL